MSSITLLFLALSSLSPVLSKSPTCPSTPPLTPPTCAYPPEPYTIQPSNGKGLGVFARHTLPAGTIILREAPIFTIRLPNTTTTPKPTYPMPQITQLVREQYALLPEPSQHEVLNLHFHAFPGEFDQGPGWDDILGYIFRTNAYNTGAAIGLFPKIARINHSCRPNAAYYWSEKLGQRIIYASREIAEGEEISDSYISLLAGREERRKKLERYGFTCTCAACSQTALGLAESDARRRDIGRAFTAFAGQLDLEVALPDTRVARRKARSNARASLELAELVEMEGLADYYAQAYKIVAVSHARVGDWETASVWANKGFERRVMEDRESGWTAEMWEMTSGFIERWKEELKVGGAGGV
ncbi:SET domain-containing protein [Byssothecium circinans]|uniref:SET domain-containing protein n=1 Tax=Byssothecium circinans TaxID=147558 RepID=A0A6A5UPY1_9PLEO|nr:SET domain-containing protein [Byssothecium circinans]